MHGALTLLKIKMAYMKFTLPKERFHCIQMKNDTRDLMFVLILNVVSTNERKDCKKKLHL